MKRIWLMLIMICSVCAFTACSDDDDKDDDGDVTCPVTNAALDKTTVEVGDEVVLSGEGFTATSKLSIKKDTEIALTDLQIATDGKSVTFTVPDVDAGTYNLILRQNGKDWDLKLTLNVEVKTKRLAGMTVNFGDPINFKFNYTDDQLTSITQINEDNSEYEYFTFTYSDNTIGITVNQTGTYPRELGNITYENGLIKSFSDYAWTYTSGYLTSAIIGGRGTMTVEAAQVYESGNLQKLTITEPMAQPTEYKFSYEGNRPEIKGIDVAGLYAQFQYGSWQTPLFVAQISNMTGKISANLPSALVGTKTEFSFDENNNMIETKKDVTCDFTDYAVDAKGYITKVVLDDQLKFKKDLIVTFTWE